MRDSVIRKDWLEEFDKVPGDNYSYEEKANGDDLIGILYLNKINSIKQGTEAVRGNGLVASSSTKHFQTC